MRYERLSKRHAVVMAWTCLAMLAFYLGRVTVKRTWAEVFAVTVWMINTAIWWIPLVREKRREVREFKEMLRRTEESIRSGAPEISIQQVDSRKIGPEAWAVGFEVTMNGEPQGLMVVECHKAGPQ